MRALKTGFKLVSNYLQAVSSLIGLPPVMERVIAGARKTEREELENERETQREREKERKRETEKTEKDRETDRERKETERVRKK